MFDFEFDPLLVPKLKLGLHSAQILLSFVAWCLEIAVFQAKDAKITGNNGWTFAVCFLSAPAWIYLIGTPRFERTRRFAQPHAMLTVDALFTVLWLSAFSTQAAYNSADKCGEGCNLSKAIVALGVIITLLFGGTTFLSAYSLQHYNFHGNLPGYDARKLRSGENIDPDKAAFSMAPHDDEAYERVNMDDHEAQGSNYGGGGSRYDSNSYGGANPYSADDDDPNRYGSRPPRNNGSLFDSETDYNSTVNAQNYPQSHGAQSDYDDHSQSHGAQGGGYDDHTAQFPAANYDRVPALNRM